MRYPHQSHSHSVALTEAPRMGKMVRKYAFDFVPMGKLVDLICLVFAFPQTSFPVLSGTQAL